MRLTWFCFCLHVSKFHTHEFLFWQLFEKKLWHWAMHHHDLHLFSLTSQYHSLSSAKSKLYYMKWHTGVIFNIYVYRNISLFSIKYLLTLGILNIVLVLISRVLHEHISNIMFVKAAMLHSISHKGRKVFQYRGRENMHGVKPSRNIFHISYNQSYLCIYWWYSFHLSDDGVFSNILQKITLYK